MEIQGKREADKPHITRVFTGYPPFQISGKGRWYDHDYWERLAREAAIREL